jgi:hypothetical protein
MFILAVVVLLAFGVLYSRSEWLVKKATKHLGTIADKWKLEADPALYMEALLKYEEIANNLRDVKSRYERARQAYIEQLHRPELEQYLSKFTTLIADAGPLTSEKLSYLYDNGIKTAADLSRERFKTLPRIMQNKEQQDLLAWRGSLEAQFWKSHNYKLTIHQERKLIVDLRKENDRQRELLENAPSELESLASRLRERQEELASDAERYVQVLQHHGPRLLALEGNKGAS